MDTLVIHPTVIVIEELIFRSVIFAIFSRPCGHRLDLPAGHPCRLAATVTCPACGFGSVSSLLPRGGVSVEDEGGEDSGVRLWLGVAPGPRGGGGGGRS